MAATCFPSTAWKRNLLILHLLEGRGFCVMQFFTSFYQIIYQGLVGLTLFPFAKSNPRDEWCTLIDLPWLSETLQIQLYELDLLVPLCVFLAGPSLYKKHWGIGSTLSTPKPRWHPARQIAGPSTDHRLRLDPIGLFFSAKLQ